MAEQYDLAAVRRLLSDAFNAGEISTLAFDLFPPVYGDFTAGMERDQMIRRIVEYAVKNGKIPELLDYVQKQNPYQYGRHAHHFPQNPLTQQQLAASPPQPGTISEPGPGSATETGDTAKPQTALDPPSEPLTGIPTGEQPVESRPAPSQTNSPVPAAVEDKHDKPDSLASPQREVDPNLLIGAVVAVLAIMVVSALVLRFVLEIRDVSSLVILLLIELPFVLVVIGKLTGQDFIGWLGNLFQKN